MKPRSWLILIIAIGTISLTIGLVLGLQDELVNLFNIDPTAVAALEDFLEQYLAGIPLPRAI
ncbi:MAG: hypothetical protein ACTSQK_01275 [Candidatus Heimdallarchaeota archaeon]